MPYFCARLLIVCLVDDGKPHKRISCDYPFVLVKAKDHEQAFKNALVLGKNQEARYKNHKGQKVRWAFVRIEEIKELPRSLDGIEVGSLLGVFAYDSPTPFGRRFNPAKHKPQLT